MEDATVGVVFHVGDKRTLTVTCYSGNNRGDGWAVVDLTGATDPKLTLYKAEDPATKIVNAQTMTFITDRTTGQVKYILGDTGNEAEMETAGLFAGYVTIEGVGDDDETVTYQFRDVAINARGAS